MRSAPPAKFAFSLPSNIDHFASDLNRSLPLRRRLRISRLQQLRDLIPEPLVPSVFLASRVPIHGEIRRRKRQRQVVCQDREPLGEMSSDARRESTDRSVRAITLPTARKFGSQSATLRTNPIAASAVSHHHTS